MGKINIGKINDGNIYAIAPFESRWIVKADWDCPYIHNGEYSSCGNFGEYDDAYVTEKEKAHLEACIKAGKYVYMEDTRKMNKIIELNSMELDGNTSKFYVHKNNANAGTNSHWLAFKNESGYSDILISKQFYEAAILEAHRDTKEKMGL